MSDHALYSPSNTRWPFCPGSIREEAKYPDTAGAAAKSGTGSHLLLDMVIKDFNAQEGEKKFSEDAVTKYIGVTIGGNDEDGPWTVKKDRAERVQVVIDYLAERLVELGPGAVLLSEMKTDPGKPIGQADRYGTCDITLYNNTLLEVGDFKDGRTYVPVTTTQLSNYGVGQLHFLESLAGYKIPTIRKVIIQPRHKKEPIRYVNCSRDELIAEGVKLGEAVVKCQMPDAPLISGDHCRWCKHKPECVTQNLAPGDTITVHEIKQMTDEQIKQVLDEEKKIKKFLVDVRAEGKKRAEKGTNVCNYGIIEGRLPNAEWIDEKKVITRLRGMRFKLGDYSKVKISTPTQVLSLFEFTDIQRKNLEKLIHRPKRPLVFGKINQRSAQEMFGEQKAPNQEISKQVMTAKAEFTYDEYIAAGWNDGLLIEHLLMEKPNG